MRCLVCVVEELGDFENNVILSVLENWLILSRSDDDSQTLLEIEMCEIL